MKTAFIPCDQHDPKLSGSYQSHDGQSLCLVKEIELPEENISGQDYIDKMSQVAQSVRNEVLRAKSMFPTNFVNQHEAYAVLLEEVDEIKKNQKVYDLDAQRKEATQAAAMLFRLLIEIL